MLRPLPWNAGTWLNPPPHADIVGKDLVVSTGENTDFWRTTSYGFVRDNGHALLTDLPNGTAVEVTFIADFTTLYDQAGVMVRIDETTWIKAGLEVSDGIVQLGAVVTRNESDWSAAPVQEWAGRPVTIRASRAGDAVTIRARCQDESWRFVRLAPLAPHLTATAGPFCCSPQRSGLTIRFTRFDIGEPDVSLH
ncbi:DUF1349 domain-containing protein [Nocardia salmonicida]